MVFHKVRKHNSVDVLFKSLRFSRNATLKVITELIYSAESSNI